MLGLQWDAELNGRPAWEVGPYSAQRAGWKCLDCGYTWRAIISARVKKMSGCPQCRAAAR